MKYKKEKSKKNTGEEEKLSIEWEKQKEKKFFLIPYLFAICNDTMSK
jgi:hypothetical protein